MILIKIRLPFTITNIFSSSKHKDSCYGEWDAGEPVLNYNGYTSISVLFLSLSSSSLVILHLTVDLKISLRRFVSLYTHRANTHNLPNFWFYLLLLQLAFSHFLLKETNLDSSLMDAQLVVHLFLYVFSCCTYDVLFYNNFICIWCEKYDIIYRQTSHKY